MPRLRVVAAGRLLLRYSPTSHVTLRFLLLRLRHTSISYRCSSRDTSLSPTGSSTYPDCQSMFWRAVHWSGCQDEECKDKICVCVCVWNSECVEGKLWMIPIAWLCSLPNVRLPSLAVISIDPITTTASPAPGLSGHPGNNRLKHFSISRTYERNISKCSASDTRDCGHH